MKACTKTRCYMVIQCTHHDAFIKATQTDKDIPVDFVDMYKPNDEGHCLNFEFKSDVEKERTGNKIASNVTKRVEPKGYWRVFHSKSKGGCGGVAFYYKTKPSPSEIPLAKDVLFADGTSPAPTDIVKCFGCGKPISLSYNCIISESTVVE